MCRWGYQLRCAISQVKCKDMFESALAKIFGQDKLAAMASERKIMNNMAFYLKSPFRTLNVTIQGEINSA